MLALKQQSIMCRSPDFSLLYTMSKVSPRNMISFNINAQMNGDAHFDQFYDRSFRMLSKKLNDRIKSISGHHHKILDVYLFVAKTKTADSYVSSKADRNNPIFLGSNLIYFKLT